LCFVWCQTRVDIDDTGVWHFVFVLVVCGTLCLFWWCVALCVCFGGVKHVVFCLVPNTGRHR